MKATKFKIAKFDSDDATEFWFGIMKDCQRVANYITRMWEFHHEQAGSAEKWHAEKAVYDVWKAKVKEHT